MTQLIDHLLSNLKETGCDSNGKFTGIDEHKRGCVMAQLKVSDLMTVEVVTVEPQEDLSTAYDLMLDHQIRHLPVVDTSGSLVGILSDRDLIRKALYMEEDLPGSLAREAMQEISVDQAMSREVITVDPNQDVRD